MNSLYLLTYKNDNGNVISQYLITAKTREGAMERIEKLYNPEYYSMTFHFICLTRDDVNQQII